MKNCHVNHNKIYKIKLVVAGFIALSLSTGILINSVGQFILPIHNDMGYSVGAVSLAFSIICAGVIFSATLIARFIDKFSPRLCMAISTAILSLFALIISFTTSIWQFYVCTAMMGLAFTGLHTLPVSVMINNAFSEKRKGFAISIAFSGSGVGGMVFNPIFNFLVDSHGWRMGFAVIACIYFIGGLVIVWLAKVPKTTINESEYMEIEVSERYDVDPSQNITVKDFEYKDAIRSRQFKLLVFSMMIVNGSGSATMMHSVPYMTNIGINSSKASFYISIFLLILAGSKLLMGLLCDKIGVGRSVKIGVACFALAMGLMLCLLISPWFYLLFFFIGGIGISTPTVTAPLMVSYLFGNKDYTRIFGATVIFTGIGNTVFPFIMGLIFDLTGSYIFGWSLLIILLLISLTIYKYIFKGNDSKIGRSRI